MASTFTVARSTTIAAAPEKIYPLIADLREWPKWSPWEKLDPQMEHRYEGPGSGTGQVHSWKGNRKAGEGRAEITSATSPSTVELVLTFLKPFKSQSTIVYTLTPGPEGTEVTWTMTGPSTAMTKIIGIFKSMDSMMGPDFEEGLANLKRESEG